MRRAEHCEQVDGGRDVGARVVGDVVEAGGQRLQRRADMVALQGSDAMPGVDRSKSEQDRQGTGYNLSQHDGTVAGKEAAGGRCREMALGEHLELEEIADVED